MKASSTINLRNVLSGCLILACTLLLLRWAHIDQHIFGEDVLDDFKTSDTPVSPIDQAWFERIQGTQHAKRQVSGQKYLLGVGKADITG